MITFTFLSWIVLYTGVLGYYVDRRQHVADRRHVAPPVFTTCPHGYVRNEGSCYIAAHDLANWPDAKVYCEAYGAHLAYIESPEEQTFIANYIHGLQGSSTDPDFYYWLGGTDAVSEGEWIWASVVRPVQYTNWNPGEPNNDAHHGSKHQDCMAIHGKDGTWDDGWCETEHNFICEIEEKFRGPLNCNTQINTRGTTNSFNIKQ